MCSIFKFTFRECSPQAGINKTKCLNSFKKLFRKALAVSGVSLTMRTCVAVQATPRIRWEKVTANRGKTKYLLANLRPYIF